MRDPTVNGEARAESVVPDTGSNSSDQLDKAGQSILRLLHKAAGVAEENSRHAVDMAQKLSHKLRAAEHRIAELEAEAEAYRDRAERAGSTRSTQKSKIVSCDKRDDAAAKYDAMISLRIKPVAKVV